MQALIMIVLSGAVLLAGCAGQRGTPATASAQSVSAAVHNLYRYDDVQKGEYKFLPSRR